MSEVERQGGSDPIEQQIHADVHSYGWHMIGVLGYEEGPPWAYTIGLYHSYNHPEIVIFGLAQEIMFGIMDNIVSELIKGKQYEHAKEYPGILEGYDCAFFMVEKQWYTAFFGRAIDFYGGTNFPMLQCVWPDKQGLYPWDNDSQFEGRFRGRQPYLFNR